MTAADLTQLARHEAAHRAKREAWHREWMPTPESDAATVRFEEARAEQDRLMRLGWSGAPQAD